jgi:hypothetical protein
MGDGELADHLISFLVDLAAALVAAWLFLKYFSTVSDYWAQRSTASVRKKTARLEALLAQYESDFSDSRTFMARIVLHATFTTVLLLSFLTAWVGILVINAVYVYTVECKTHACDEETLLGFSWYTRDFSFMVLLFLWVFMFSAFLYFLMLQASPDKYRARFRQRIARLRSRLPEEAPNRPPSVNP